MTMLLLFVLFQVHAQLYVGIETGANKNYLITSNAAEAFTRYNSAPGLSFGIPVLLQVNEWFALQTAPSFTQKNFQIQRTDFFQGIYQKNINGYLQLPILANFSFGVGKIRGYINLGFYGAYWVSGRIKGTEANILNTSDTTTQNPTNILGEDNAYSYNQRYPFSSKDNRMEFGWIGGVGMSYQLNAYYRLFLEGVFISSLTDNQKNYQINQIPRYNSTYGIEAGCLFLLYPTSIFKKKFHIF